MYHAQLAAGALLNRRKASFEILHLSHESRVAPPEFDILLHLTLNRLRQPPDAGKAVFAHPELKLDDDEQQQQNKCQQSHVILRPTVQSALSSPLAEPASSPLECPHTRIHAVSRRRQSIFDPQQPVVLGHPVGT
jgi:hypothetical protein